MINATFCEDDANYPQPSVINKIAKKLGEDQKAAMRANSVEYKLYNAKRRNHDYGGDYVEKQGDRGTKVCESIKQKITPRSGKRVKDGSKR